MTTIRKEVVLVCPDYYEVFGSNTDASSKQLGAVITQDKRPTAFFSQNSPSHNEKTVPPKLNY
jgi:hypothetical protein